MYSGSGLYNNTYRNTASTMDKQIHLQHNGFAAGLVQFFQFHPKDPNIIAATVSDGSVLLWNIDKASNQSQLLIQNKIAESITSSCWGDDGGILFSCDIMERSVFATSQKDTVQINEGAHDQPIHTIRFWQPNFYITASYDDTIKIWDIRMPPSQPVFTIQTQTQQSSMDIAKNTMAVVQCNCKGVSIFDLGVFIKNKNQIQTILYLSFFSPAENQISCVKVCPDGKKVGFGTIDGTFFMKSFQVAERPQQISYYETQARNQPGCMFQKQAHKRDGPKTTLYMVNDIVTTSKKQYIVGTAGGEGNLNLYNTSTKHLIKKHQISKQIPLKKCSINCEASMLGVALGNDYSGGFEQFGENIEPIFKVHKINEATFFSNRYY